MRLATLVLSALILLVCVGCGDSGDDDLTNREITSDDLRLMVLPQSELGSEYEDFVGDTRFGSNEDLIRDPELDADVAEDIEHFGRLNGYYSSYQSEESMFSDDQLFGVATQAELFETATGASEYWEDNLRESRDRIGASYVGRTTRQIEEFDAGDLADESQGLQILVEVLSDPDDTIRSFWFVTVVAFRHGRILAAVSIVRTEDIDLRDEARDLARKLNERIEGVLRGEITE